MEPAPLTLAYDHVRAAAVATHGSDTTVAINEHALAAGEFAKAASGTGSAEALRTLKLLEQHHARLSELLRYPSENPVIPIVEGGMKPVSEKEKPLSTSAAVAELRASKSDLGPRSASPLRNPPGLQHPRRLPPRDLSSSIASNLASARGIRANYARQPLSPSISIQQAPGSLEIHSRKDGKRSSIPSVPKAASRPSWVPPIPVAPKQVELPSSSSQTALSLPPDTSSDDGFTKFYNAFENILHKLSAPLAFAGLPIITEESSLPSTPPESMALSKGRPSTSAERLDTEPDLTKFISRAALRASARDGQSGNDSFYVVPTTGHTLSYAHILSFAEKEKRRMSASMHSENADLFPDPNEDDDFVDARETPMPASPITPRRIGGRKLSGKELENKVEELDTENTSLKDCVDKLSKRLHAFEMAAQNSSMALQESMRLMRPLSPIHDLPGRNGDEGLKRKVLDLEEHVALSDKEIDRLGRENEKLKSVVVRYRERWEKLKEGAKTRRESGMSKDGTGKDVSSPRESAE